MRRAFTYGTYRSGERGKEWRDGASARVSTERTILPVSSCEFVVVGSYSFSTGFVTAAVLSSFVSAETFVQLKKVLNWIKREQRTLFFFFQTLLSPRTLCFGGIRLVSLFAVRCYCKIDVRFSLATFQRYLPVKMWRLHRSFLALTLFVFASFGTGDGRGLTVEEKIRDDPDLSEVSCDNYHQRIDTSQEAAIVFFYRSLQKKEPQLNKI